MPTEKNIFLGISTYFTEWRYKKSKRKENDNHISW